MTSKTNTFGVNKILKTFIGGALMASTLSADIARVEMGAGAWKQTPSGSLITSEATGPLSLKGTYTSLEKDSSEMYFWMLLKHPVPIVPNFRVEYVSLADTGLFTGNVNGVDVTDAPANIDMNQFDIVPYYNILDNTAWLTLDLGLDLKMMQTDSTVVPTDVTTTSYASSELVVIPLVYVRTRVEIPVTNIGLEADVKYITDGDSTVYDVRAKVDYTFDITPVIQPGIEVGYRMQKYDISSDNVTGVLEYRGVYAGLMLRF
jgi:outer membrane protein